VDVSAHAPVLCCRTIYNEKGFSSKEIIKR
jgi:hypothetical protein